MKFQTFVSALSLYTTLGYSQTVAIQNDMDNSLWLCRDNRLTIAVEELSSKAISVSTNNGTIEENESRGPGHYIYRARTGGRAWIYVKKKNSDGSETLIDSVEHRIRRLPVGPPKFAGKSQGSLPKVWILAQLGMSVYADGSCIDWFPVHSYSVSIYRKEKEIFRRDVSGPKIDETTNTFFYTLENNDLLKFENIKVKDCDGELRSAEPIAITVSNAEDYEKGKGTTVLAEDPVTGEIVEVNIR